MYFYFFRLLMYLFPCYHCTMMKKVVYTRFEKMISGMYLGEIARIIILQCAREKLLFEGKTSIELRTSGRFYTKYISEIEACVTADVFHSLSVDYAVCLSAVRSNLTTSSSAMAERPRDACYFF